MSVFQQFSAIKEAKIIAIQKILETDGAEILKQAVSRSVETNVYNRYVSTAAVLKIQRYWLRTISYK